MYRRYIVVDSGRQPLESTLSTGHRLQPFELQTSFPTPCVVIHRGPPLPLALFEHYRFFFLVIRANSLESNKDPALISIFVASLWSGFIRHLHSFFLSLCFPFFGLLCFFFSFFGHRFPCVPWLHLAPLGSANVQHSTFTCALDVPAPARGSRSLLHPPRLEENSRQFTDPSSVIRSIRQLVPSLGML